MILALICDMERGNLEVHNFVFSPPTQGRCTRPPGSVESKLTQRHYKGKTGHSIDGVMKRSGRAPDSVG